MGNNSYMIIFRKKPKQHIILDAITLLSMGTILFVGTAWPFFRFVTYAKKKNNQSVNRKKWFSLKHTTINHPKHRFLKEYEETRSWCESRPMADWYIHSIDGIKLHAYYLPAENPKRFVVLCHGYRGTSFGSSAHIAKFLHKNNSNLLLIDQRCCGKSGGNYITFGAKEQYDVIEWVHHLNERNRTKLPIYLYGQSMGASTCLLSTGHHLPSEVKGIIADCGFHSMKQQLRDMAAGWFHLHWIELLLLRVDLFCRIFAGFSMKETNVTMALQKNQLPILYFHGEEDTYVLPENTWRNYEITKSEKEVVMIPYARHLCSSFAAPELYKRKITKFFEKYDQ